MFYFRKKHKKHKNKKEPENGDLKENKKDKKAKEKLSVVVSEDGTKREVKGEGKGGALSLVNGRKSSKKTSDSDVDIPTDPLEEEMNLDELMRQKVGQTLPVFHKKINYKHSTNLFNHEI